MSLVSSGNWANYQRVEKDSLMKVQRSQSIKILKLICHAGQEEPNMIARIRNKC